LFVAMALRGVLITRRVSILRDGLCMFNLLRTPVYLNDSVAMMTFAYDFDLESGTITNKRIFIDRRSSIGEPDGCVVE
jgi:sugar lactone lactonase YvrE